MGIFCENYHKTELKYWPPWLARKKIFHSIVLKTALNSLNRKRWWSVKKDDKLSHQLSINVPNFNANKGVHLSLDIRHNLILSQIIFWVCHRHSTIGIPCICMYVNFYWHTHDSGYAYIETYPHFFHMTFKVFKIFLVLIILHCLKTWCYIFIIYFVCPWKRQILYCLHLFQINLFFNFSYELFNKYLSLPRTLANSGY